MRQKWQSLETFTCVQHDSTGIPNLLIVPLPLLVLLSNVVLCAVSTLLDCNYLRYQSSFVKDIEQKNSFFFIRSIINYFVCLVTIVVTMFIFFLLVCNRIF